MTLQDLINWFSSNPKPILSYFIVILAVAILGLLFVKEANFKQPIPYLYTGLIYAVAIPGILAFILTLYSFFFLKQNLLQLDLFSYFAPIVFMIGTLLVIHKTIPLSKIPGFGKLSGVFTIIMITFLITYVLQKMFFGVFFIGRFQYLIALFLVLLFVVRLAWNKIIK